MKKILLINFLLAVAANFSSAQTPVLYGTCFNGGASNWGTIFQANLDGSNLHTVYSFLNPEGAWPWGKTVQAPNGKIYGVTYLGGCMDSCTLYEYDPVLNTCIDVYDFYCTPPTGEPSQGGLMILPDGNLYGHQQNGILYKFNPNTHVYTLLHQTAGAYYWGGLMQGTDGALYGVSYMGGTSSQGYIFRFDLTTQAYSIVHSFDGIHGGHPRSVTLIQATDGKLYGATYDGGANSKGVIFSYDLSANVYSDLHDFDSTQGKNPYNGLIQATDGKLYGMTYAGGNTNNSGVIFSYDISASQYSVFHNFNGVNGANPSGGLTQASNGKLFGTTYNGGTNNGGVAFSYDIASSTYTVLTNFIMATGAHPQCDIQEATVEFTTGMASANSSPALIYVDAAQQLIVQSSKFKENAALIVYDALGKNILQAEIHPDASGQKSGFDLSSYPRGIYFVQLKDNSQTITRKIILSK